jgi:hypothetical protein
MSVTFTCACGTLLRPCQRTGQRPSVCPVCGLPVGLLTLESAQEPPRPLPPPPAPPRSERATPSRAAVEDEPAAYDLEPLPLEADAPSPSWRPPAWKGSWARGRPAAEWFWRPLFWLSAALTAVTVILRALWLEDRGVAELWFLTVFGAVGLAVLGYAWALLQCVFYCATGTKKPEQHWPGVDPRLLLKSVRDGLVSFLAGPVVFAVVGVLFWLEAGELERVDELILAQLALAAFCGWLLAFTAVTASGRLRDALPAGVVQLVCRLGWRGGVGALVGGAAILAHGLWALSALEETHRSFGGWMSLLFCWASLLGCTAAALYWLGRCWSRGGAPAAEAHAPESPPGQPRALAGTATSHP